MRYLKNLLGIVTLMLTSICFAITPKDTLVIADRIDDMMTLDPAAMFELTAMEYAYNTYDRLIAYDEKSADKFTGVIAKSWVISKDGLTYNFVIRDDLKFASGNPITAEDVAFSLQRVILLSKSPSSILSQFGFTKDNVSKQITVPKADRVQLQFSTAYAPSLILNCLTAPVASVVEKKQVLAHEVNGDLGNKWLTTNHAGSGPFKLKKWMANQLLSLEKNQYYPLQHPINKVLVRHVSEAATQKLLLEKNDVDVARNLQANNLKLSKNLYVQTALTGNLRCLYLNQSNPNIKHQEVRQAIKHLIDYQAIKNNLLAGQVEIQQSFIPKGYFAANTSNPFSYDLAKAKTLLKQAGLENGFSINLDAKDILLAQVLQASFATAGIKVSIIPGDSNQVLTKFRARNYDAILATWGTDYQDPHANAVSFTNNPDNSANSTDKTIAWRTSWDIPELTKLTATAARELNLTKRQQLYAQLQEKFFADSPIIILFQDTDVAAVNKKVIDLKIGVNPATNVFHYIPVR